MSPTDEAFDSLLPLVEDWYLGDGLGGGPVRTVHTNTAAAGIHLCGLLKEHWPFDDSVYATGSQVRGLSGASVTKALIGHGETRSFRSEGGRTSRGTLRKAHLLAEIFRTGSQPPLRQLSADQRTEVAHRLQGWFVNRLQRDYFDKQVVEADIDPDSPVSQSIEAIVRQARLRGGSDAGAVAQHLVGAKLQLRFPQHGIGVDSHSTADQQTGRHGDFQVGETVFHVTMAPSEQLMTVRCRDNIRHGFRPVVIVPGDRVVAAQQLAENGSVLDKTGVVALEVFVGVNIEEMGTYTSQGIRSGLRLLLETYNARIAAVESDQSLQVRIPENL